MEHYKSIFGGILSSEGVYLDRYLESLDEHNVFSIKNNDDGTIQHVTSLLTTSTTKLLGFRLLSQFIDSSSVAVLETKGNLWITLTLKALSNQELKCDDHTPLIINVLNKIIKYSVNAPDLMKSIVSTHMSKVYESLTNIPLSKSKYSLSCVETCLRAYPGSSAPSRGIIERYLWKHIDHVDDEIIQNCGKCLHLLQQVKGGGIEGINHKTQWKNYQLQLLGGIHAVYNEMFSKCKEIYEDKIEQAALPWEAVQIRFDPDPVKKAAQMYNRCHNLIAFLSIALREPFPVEKPILIKKILNVIVRGLSVNCVMLERNPTADTIALSILLPRLHVDLLNLLDVAITVLRGHIRPYSDLILSLIVDVFKCTSAKSGSGDKRTMLSVRKKVYDTVSLWCKVLSGGNRCETIVDYLFQEILIDITPPQDELTLKVLSGARKHMSKKARRQLHSAQNQKSNIVKTNSVDKNVKQNAVERRTQELCISALRCLYEICFSVGNLVKPTTLKMIQMSITQTSAILYEHPQRSGHLYSSENCRIEIYNALYSILMATHHLCPPPTDLILTTIQTAYARDDSPKVRFTCGFILKNLEKIIHPQKESLLFTISARDIRNTFIKMGQENMLSEFQLNLSGSLHRSHTTDDELEVQEPSDAIDNNEPNNHKTQELITSTTVNTNEIDNNRINIKDMDVVESVQDKVMDVDNDLLYRETFTRNEDVEIAPKVKKNIISDVDVNHLNGDDDALNCGIVDEPITKKQKLEVEQNKTDGTEDHNDDDDHVLTEIASQFIDELE